MAVIVYSLDRSTNNDNLPFAEVVNVQKYRLNEKPAPAPTAHYSSPPPATSSNPPPYCAYLQRPRYPVQTSLSCALNPVGSMPPSHYTHAASDSMLL